jgi:hypothetical protein
LDRRLIGTAHNAPLQSPQLQAAEERERQAGRRQREPIGKLDYRSSIAFEVEGGVKMSHGFIIGLVLRS